MEINKENYDELKNQKLKRAEIAERFGIPDWKLKRIISENGWGRKIPKYTYNGSFDSVTKESAYWLGFLFADGCVDNKNRVRLMLQESDRAHILKFRKFVGATEFQVQECAGYSRTAIEFTSSLLCSKLAKFGIIPRKTLTSTPPDIEILGEYLRDFLRGLFDGDGTICESFSNRNSKLATLYMGFAIAKQSMPWLHTVLTDIVGVTYKSFERENIYTITLNTNKSIQLLNFMYEDTTEDIRLDRKYNLYTKTVVMGNRKTR